MPAIRRLREEMGFDNVVVMIPFCRSTEEADRVLAVMADNGLERGKNGLEVYVMCEIPSNVILAEAVRRAVRRVLHRLQRSHAAHARRRSRFSAVLSTVRRAGRRREEDDRRASSPRHKKQAQSVSAARRPATIPNLPFPGGARHRFDLGEPGQFSGRETGGGSVRA